MGKTDGIRIRKGLALFALCAVFLFGRSLHAAEYRVLLVYDEASSYHQEFAAAFDEQLKRSTVDVEVVYGNASLASAPEPRPGNSAAYNLIVTIGSDNARLALERKPITTTLLTLLPLSTYHRLTGGKHTTASALVIDQPVDRYLRLIRAALPELKRIGSLHGSHSKALIPELRQAAEELGLELQTETLSEQENLDDALERILRRAQILLTLADTEVVNSNTAKTLILGAYLRHIPIIGYSQSYVKAGALMAVHTTPAQYGRQAAEMVAASLNGRPMPKLVHPRYYAVSVNYQVARALGLRLPAETELHDLLQEMEH